MAIPNLRTKLKANLKKSIEKEQAGGRDNRFLNFFNLSDGEKMTVLLVPDVNGEFWSKFSKHGPQLHIMDGKQRRGVRGAGAINCSYKSSGEDCPACQKGFDLLNLSKETGDEHYKNEAKKWFSKDFVLVQCIVLDSPIEVTASDDGNQVKLMYLPHNIEKIIKENITEEQIDEDDLCRTPFVIKKTKNQGGMADYSTSYFKRNTINDEDLDFLEDMKVEQYDFSNLDLVPSASTTEEVQEWLDKAEEAYDKALNGGSGSDSGSDEPPADKKKKEDGNGKLDSLKDRAKKQAKESDEGEDDNFDSPDENSNDSPVEQEEPDADEPEGKSAPATSAKDRLSRLKGRRN